MSRLNSFYLATEDWPTAVGEMAVLQGAEAKHMLTVLRTEPDQIVRLFDGNGRDGLFRVNECSKKRALLETVELNDHPAPSTGVTLAIGWGKSKRRNYLFEKSVELKGDGVVFWEARRSQSALPKAPKDTWHDKCVQAAKQCGNPFLPEISVCSGGVAGLIDFARQFDACYLAWEAETAGHTLHPSHLSGKRSLVVIGPEGGIEDTEAKAFIEAGFEPVTFGNTIMRWETAATYCLSLAWLAQQDVK